MVPLLVMGCVTWSTCGWVCRGQLALARVQPQGLVLAIGYVSGHATAMCAANQAACGTAWQ
jgi:hypothetical protein